MYEFKNLNEVDQQDKPTENTTVMAFESGNPKQIPASEFGGKGLMVDLRGYTLNTDGDPIQISDISYDPIYEAITAGQNVVLRVKITVAEAEAKDIDLFLTPLGYEVLPDVGFLVMAFVDFHIPIMFTNGSYHTTT